VTHQRFEKEKKNQKHKAQTMTFFSLLSLLVALVNVSDALMFYLPPAAGEFSTTEID
jgi:hypothetical protein